jgi:hypothetical protein
VVTEAVRRFEDGDLLSGLDWPGGVYRELPAPLTLSSGEQAYRSGAAS